MKRILFLPLLFVVLSVSSVQAQYFGRNKPVYQKLDFKVHETAHFIIYDYLDNPAKLSELAADAELWYSMHQAVLHDTLAKKNPLIIYSDHAGFQQTNTISGEVNVGTGGVTEGLRNRVIFPVAMTNQQTNHVLGHEMVHAFQYNMILNGDSTNMRNMANLPLWMVEGLAEYLSIGRIDAHTALWMRDAVLNDDLPRIKDLDNYKYFPYRWGQSFWAFVAGTYGDQVIPVLFTNTAKYGLQIAVQRTLGTTTEKLSDAWQETLKNHYGRWVVKGKKEDMPGKKLLSDDNAGKMNISPVLSPNGKYVIFLSEKNLFTTDLFLADAKTGKILKKVASTSSDGHIDQLNAIESAGTWAPDDKRYAFDVYEKGRSVLIIKDVFKGKTVEKISIPGVPAFSNPAWSPDGKTIVVSGLVNGQTDLYAYTLKSRKVQRLTNDHYSEILPAWSADGKYLAFSTDQFSRQRGRTNGVWTMNLAILDVVGGTEEMIDVFPGADNLNPQFDKSGNIFFLSNRDGFRNLYRYEPASKKVFQLTKIMTGITGITPYAPAITVADDRDRILYTHYFKGEYVIYQAKSEDFEAEEVSSSAVDMVPATLPPFDPSTRDLVNTNLRLMDNTIKEVADKTNPVPVRYNPKFSLEYLGGGAGAGIATGNSSFGQASGLAGGVDMLFGDILGNNKLYAGLALNGEIQDIAGQASYINQKNRINWGISLSHIPYQSGNYIQDADFEPKIEQTLDGTQYVGYQDYLLIDRLFQERLGLFTFYPLSATRRFEVGGAYEFYHQRRDVYYLYLDPYGRQIGQEKKKISTEPGFGFSNVNAAFVSDNSHFGLTAPLQGHRARIGVEQYFGAYQFSTLLLDGRRYFRLKPLTLAVRGLAYGRFGQDTEAFTAISPLFVGNPWFVRGYNKQEVYTADSTLFDQTVGSKIGVANFEIRLPFTGPRRLSLINSRFLVTDLNLFFDAGIAINKKSDLNPEDPDPGNGLAHLQHKPILSTGISLRVNLFGALVLEPYFALPLSVKPENRNWTFGLNFVPGW